MDGIGTLLLTIVSFAFCFWCAFGLIPKLGEMESKNYAKPSSQPVEIVQQAPSVPQKSKSEVISEAVDTIMKELTFTEIPEEYLTDKLTDSYFFDLKYGMSCNDVIEILRNEHNVYFPKITTPKTKIENYCKKEYLEKANIVNINNARNLILNDIVSNEIDFRTTEVKIENLSYANYSYWNATITFFDDKLEKIELDESFRISNIYDLFDTPLLLIENTVEAFCNKYNFHFNMSKSTILEADIYQIYDDKENKIAKFTDHGTDSYIFKEFNKLESKIEFEYRSSAHNWLINKQLDQYWIEKENLKAKRINNM